MTYIRCERGPIPITDAMGRTIEKACASVLESRQVQVPRPPGPRLLVLLADVPHTDSTALAVEAAVPDFRAYVMAANGDVVCALEMLAGRARRQWPTPLPQRATLHGQIIIALALVNTGTAALPHLSSPLPLEAPWRVAAVDTADTCYLVPHPHWVYRRPDGVTGARVGPIPRLLADLLSSLTRVTGADPFLNVELAERINARA